MGKSASDQETYVSEAEEYMSKAADCRDKSSKSPYPADKASWLHLADQWTRRAERCDAAARIPVAGAREFIGRFFSEK